MYVVNGVSLALVWFVGRILLFLAFFYKVWMQRTDLVLLSRLSQALVLVVPLALFALNIMWFTKIVRGASKMVAKRAVRVGWSTYNW